MLANCITSTIPADAAPELQRLLAHYQSESHALLQILREWQALQGWLSAEAMSQIAGALGLTLAQVQGVAGFYRFLHTRPVGVYRVLFSDNVTDRMLGSAALLADLCQRLGVVPGQVNSNGLVSVDRASCTGLCDQGPALLINHHQVITRLDAARVAAIAELILGRVPVAQWPPAWFEVQDNIRRADLLLGTPAEPGAALALALARGADATLAEIKRANLRGRGGAGFATGLKLELCRQALGAQHVVLCNADEGEPGTFKDRVLLTRHADAVFEGMTIVAHVLGARRGFVYLRGEYRYLLESLKAVLQRRRAAQLLGANILGQAGFDFDIAIHVGGGAYVCGEESALIESLEGKRGYLGHPTVVNNVETFCAAAHIAQHGGAAWAAIGTAKSTGTKIHSVSGDCARPGLYEYPLGTRVSRILADCDARNMFEVARGFAQFFAHESCGFCTPCRVGTALLVKRMDKLAAGRGSNDDLDVLFELDRLLHSTTHCGLGASACNPLRDTVLKFRPAYEKRLQSLSFEPGFDLDAELSIARRLTGRDDAGAHF